MTDAAKRKYLPSEAYRFLVLSALAHRRGGYASKGELAWETRANHYMITRVLRELSTEGLIRVSPAGSGAYDIAITREGEALHARTREALATVFAARLAEHFRYGSAPPWAAFVASW